MNTIWMFAPELETAQKILVLSRPDENPTVRILDEDIQNEYQMDIVWPIVSNAQDGDEARLNTLPPPVRLAFTEPGMAPDYFDIGFGFVSARARAAMALSDRHVQWLPVDATESTEAVQAQDYRVLHVVQTADPFDRAATDGEMTDYLRPDGSLGERWAPRVGQPNRPWPRIGFRADFVPPAPLFREWPVGRIMATDAFAARVRGAGIRDIMFLDMTNDGTRTEPLIVRPD